MGTLPANLGAAVVELEGDTVLREALGEHIFTHYLDSKKKEWGEYIAQVSDWELKTYLPTYCALERSGGLETGGGISGLAVCFVAQAPRASAMDWVRIAVTATSSVDRPGCSAWRISSTTSRMRLKS